MGNVFLKVLEFFVQKRLRTLSFCIEEETKQEKFVSGCKYCVCECHVSSCVASLFCLFNRRSSITTMEYIL